MVLPGCNKHTIPVPKVTPGTTASEHGRACRPGEVARASNTMPLVWYTFKLSGVPAWHQSVPHLLLHQPVLLLPSWVPSPSCQQHPQQTTPSGLPCPLCWCHCLCLYRAARRVGVWVLLLLRACRLPPGTAGPTCCPNLTGQEEPQSSTPVVNQRAVHNTWVEAFGTCTQVSGP
jgi:hypothetical protein